MFIGSGTLGRIQQAFPADTEAAIFHALSLIAVQPKTDTTYTQLREAAAILEPLSGDGQFSAL